jgi:hypothetical protein
MPCQKIPQQLLLELWAVESDRKLKPEPHAQTRRSRAVVNPGSKNQFYKCIKCMRELGIGCKKISRLTGMKKSGNWPKPSAAGRALMKEVDVYSKRKNAREQHGHTVSEATVAVPMGPDQCPAMPPILPAKPTHEDRMQDLEYAAAYRMKSRKASLAAYYKHHERSKRRSAERARTTYLNTPKGSNNHIKRVLRSRIYNAIWRITGARRPRTNGIRTGDLIGCTIDELKSHLSKRFKPGMSWANHGEWHIDHIIPCSAFDLTNTDEQMRCFHFSNLQPLWAEENLSKSNAMCA